jgi:hypothetical protein
MRLLTGEHKNISFSLSLKTIQNDTIYKKISVGVGGVQNVSAVAIAGGGVR